MNDTEVVDLATQDAVLAIEYARGSESDRVVFITGNSHMPPLRAFGSAETVWQFDEAEDIGFWELYAQTFESLVEEANVYLGSPEDDNCLYVVDQARFRLRDDADEAEYLTDEWEEVV